MIARCKVASALNILKLNSTDSAARMLTFTCFPIMFIVATVATPNTEEKALL